MGERFPLTHSVHPMRGGVVYLLLGAVLLLVLPVAYLLDTGARPEWWTFIVLAGGLACAVGTVAALRMRVRFVIDEKSVSVAFRTLSGTQSTVVPLSEYVALVTTALHEPAFVGTRPVHHIVLWHRDDSMKQVQLWVGHDEKKLAARLAQYQALFGLPVNPPGLQVLFAT